MTDGPVVIIHGVRDATRPDEADTLRQVEEVSAALARLGYATDALALSFDLSPLRRIPADALVFNLVEALEGDGRLLHLPVAVLEHHGLTFTGSGSAAIALTTDKVLTKRLLHAAGLPVPQTVDAPAAADPSARYIVKSLSEDASFGIDAGSVVAGGGVSREIERRRNRYGGGWFAERYIDGREFNMSVIEGADGRARVLPAAEIKFIGYRADQPRIVDYAAKWDETSHAYHNTPRRFVSHDAEQELVAELGRLSLAAWAALGLEGYARVDFRVDDAGRCYILEANANPCLASDAGFIAACGEAGIAFDDAIELIVAAARRRSGGRPRRRKEQFE
ncbi:MAG: hypothetical protein ACK4MF_00230 [Hyphomicrobiaceae bacterium]